LHHVGGQGPEHLLLARESIVDHNFALDGLAVLLADAIREHVKERGLASARGTHDEEALAGHGIARDIFYDFLSNDPLPLLLLFLFGQDHVDLKFQVLEGQLDCLFLIWNILID